MRTILYYFTFHHFFVINGKQKTILYDLNVTPMHLELNLKELVPPLHKILDHNIIRITPN